MPTPAAGSPAAGQRVHWVDGLRHRADRRDNALVCGNEQAPESDALKVPPSEPSDPRSAASEPCLHAGGRHYGLLGRLLGTRFDAVANVKRLAVPLLVARGDRDEIVRLELGKRLFGAAPEPKRFVRVRGAHQYDVFDRRRSSTPIAGFAREFVRTC